MIKNTLKIVVGLLIVNISGLANAATGVRENIVRIEPGKEVDSSTVTELKRRVLQLELAVEQLQRRVFDSYEGGVREVKPVNNHACYMVVKGKTYTSEQKVRTKAIGELLKACNLDNTPGHCHEKDITCGN